MHASGQSSMQEWKSAADKGSDRFWNNDNEQFLHDYALEMVRNSKYYVETARDDVIACMKDLQAMPRPHDDLFDNLEQKLQQSLEAMVDLSIWSSQRPVGGRSGDVTVRVLSLGCGPGTDLAAIVTILAQDPRVATVECVGVDLLKHPLACLFSYLETVAGINSSLQIRLKSFDGVDLRYFAHFCQEIGMKFDLVSARYMNAIGGLTAFRGPVPRLLGDAGRVLLLDNLSEQLARLTSFGYIDRVDKRQIPNQIFLVYQKPSAKPATSRRAESESADSEATTGSDESEEESVERDAGVVATRDVPKKRARFEASSSDTAASVATHGVLKRARFESSSSDADAAESEDEQQVAVSPVPDNEQDVSGSEEDQESVDSDEEQD